MPANPADVSALVTRPVTGYPTLKMNELLDIATPRASVVRTHQRYDWPRVRAGGGEALDGPTEQTEPDAGQASGRYTASNTCASPASVSIQSWYDAAALTLFQL